MRQLRTAASTTRTVTPRLNFADILIQTLRKVSVFNEWSGASAIQSNSCAALGCVHAFANASSEPVRWLETFSPQPPAENVFRFVAEWEQRANKVDQ